MDDSDLVVSESAVLGTAGDVSIPEFGVIEQEWSTDPIEPAAIPDRAAEAVSNLELDDVPPSGEVALGVGSRGIAHIGTITAGVVDALRDRGYEPFVFPAMGSHGGATAAGQAEMLAELGVTESTVGCEIRSSMDVVEIGSTADRDVPVVASADAVSADAIVPINRVKPHTGFDGAVESGLSKMLVIGMGKQRGAKTAHSWALDWSFRNMIPEITEQLLSALPIAGGIAIVEDEHDEPTVLEGVPPAGFLDRERELLEIAYDRMPRLPFDEIDILVVDRQGKEVSGQGMDTNVIGRRPFAINEPAPEQPTIKRIYTRSLTDATHGNAMGMGQADFVHRDLLAEIDSETTLTNALTASTPRGVRLPPVVETDRAGLIACLSTVGASSTAAPRVLRVPDTAHLEQLYASKALCDAALERSDLTVVEQPTPIAFDDGAFAAPTLTERD